MLADSSGVFLAVLVVQFVVLRRVLRIFIRSVPAKINRLVGLLFHGAVEGRSSVISPCSNHIQL